MGHVRARQNGGVISALVLEAHRCRLDGLAEAGQQARRRHSAANTVTVSRATWPGRLSAGATHSARARSRVAAW